MTRIERLEESPGSSEHHATARFAHAVGLPAPQGWIVPLLRRLAVWFVGNVGWIVGGLVTAIHLPDFRPPPGWAPHRRRPPWQAASPRS